MERPLPSTLLVHVDADEGDKLCDQLRQRGSRAFCVADFETASVQLQARPFEVVALPWTGSAELTTLAGREPDVRFVVACRGANEAAEAIAAGALEVVDAPFEAAALIHALERLAQHSDPRGEDAPPEPAPQGRLVGVSKAMKKVAEMVDRAAAGSATVLIRGESGTGKELVARAIHDRSDRANKPFVKIHCAALPDTLLESELFGYEKGAFTGATTRKPGRVDVAEGGTLFLDEIGDITPAMQVKLLRLLQDKEYERLGSVGTRKANVRFVAATHRDLEGMVKKGEFREDLFYRLNVVPLWIPPLRARRDDIELLAREFCESFGAEAGKPSARLSDDAVALLRGQRWPGNVRQLQNLVERLVVLSDDGVIDARDVKTELSPESPFSTQHTSTGAPPSTTGGPVSSVVPLSEEVRMAEKRALLRALKHTKGNRTLAARVLGVSRATLYNKLAEHGLV